jgi:microcystin-dependent protein
MEAFLGQIVAFAGNYAPVNWALCDGKLLPIMQYQALFAILGTTYGGDGKTTFALPDLNGRTPIGAGRGTGLTARNLGEKGGAEKVTLTTAQLPTHVHETSLKTGAAGEHAAATPAKAILATGDATGSTTAGSSSIMGPTGNSMPHENMPPYLAINYIICIQGMWPNRE